jgi:hypothetical protein
MGLVAFGCALETPELLRSQISQAHQTCDSVLAAGFPLFFEFLVDARATIDTVIVIVYGLSFCIVFRYPSPAHWEAVCARRNSRWVKRSIRRTYVVPEIHLDGRPRIGISFSWVREDGHCFFPWHCPPGQV